MIHVNTDNIVMWVILQNNADWDCFKTPILLEILRTQNLLQPTMRHVSKTRRVALDWLFDRINLDPKIQIKYIDTKNQLADILTKGNFTRDEWNHFCAC